MDAICNCGAGDGKKGRTLFKEKEQRSNEVWSKKVWRKEKWAKEIWCKKIWRPKEIWFQDKGDGAQFWNVQCSWYLNSINWQAASHVVMFFSQNKLTMYLKETLSSYPPNEKAMNLVPLILQKVTLDLADPGGGVGKELQRRSLRNLISRSN